MGIKAPESGRDELTNHPRAVSYSNLSYHHNFNTPHRAVITPPYPLVPIPPDRVYTQQHNPTEAERDAARAHVQAWLAEGVQEAERLSRKPCWRCQQGRHCGHCAACCDR